MTKQSTAFYGGEGDKWYERNRNKVQYPLGDDPVMNAIINLAIKPKKVLEIGCSNGWRLEKIRNLYSGLKPEVTCYGIDPSLAAITEGQKAFPKLILLRRDATNLPHRLWGGFDIIIYGFCLYLCDREDLFKIAYESDHFLKNGGYLLIHDFFPLTPCSVVYHHKPSLRSFKMDHSQLFLANPVYKEISRNVPDEKDEIGVVVLKKDFSSAFPLVEQ